MKAKSEYSSFEKQQLQKFKLEIEYLRRQLLDIDEQVNKIKQNYLKDALNQAKTNYQESSHNNNSETQSEEDKEKLWGNYILVILLMFYFVVMSFL